MMRSPRHRQVALWCACVAGALCGPPLTAGAAGAAEPDRVIVARAPGLSSPERAALRAAVGARLVRSLGVAGLEVLEIGRMRRAAALERLRRRSDVRFAEPDVRVRALDDPDPFPLPYGIERIAAPAGWSLSTGAGVTVAVVDTGVAFDHPDLAGRIAVNPGELANGIDDDGNGVADDIRGWDFVDGDNLPFDENGHGSLVAGIVAAHGAISGVAPDARVLPLRVLDENGEGYLSDIAAAFDYAGASGVPIVNASLGARLASSPTMDAVFAAHPGTLYVAAAGNDGIDNDVAPTFPCASQAPNVVCVGASDQLDTRAPFSNVGARTVDVFAPGVDIVSTIGTTYAQENGTSFAAPHVAGVAALVRAHSPGAGSLALKSAVLAGPDRIPALAGLAVTGARANAARSLTASPADADGDGAGDDWDACPTVVDPAQRDQDDDGIGDACEPGTPPPAPAGPRVEDCADSACRAPEVRSISARADRGRRRVVVRVRPDRSGTIYVTVARRRGCSSVRCSWRTVAARRVVARRRGPCGSPTTCTGASRPGGTASPCESSTRPTGLFQRSSRCGSAERRLSINAAAVRHRIARRRTAPPRPGGSAMRYLLLIYTDESTYASMSEAELQADMAKWGEYTNELIEAGASPGGEALQPTSTATTVRDDGGKPIVTDGPFAETKEQLGGYYMLDVENLDAAIEWAHKCPAAKYGRIELRPIQEYEQG